MLEVFPIVHVLISPRLGALMLESGLVSSRLNISAKTTADVL
ncbi:hypothetical protein D035_0605 [Vibrio parahaemolyticus VP250]|nr:hypothetical protein D035_0605 [Vibrio parahaemolyticus VP250]EQM05868.1 hypothetical protein D036_0246 [Vibrio parahaemolyticus VP232]EQM09522.1 hypothetical protein D045_2843 [Vibrio parahaemolyticus VP-NY4]ETT15450.1 hypothetical protein D028_2963 [Vibrio parahaemolyticus 50]ETX25830.1 hypothetical protein D037_0545 [Vibrio parahaemolyticus IDH02640]